MIEFLKVFPSWILSIVALAFLFVILDRIYLSKDQIVLFGKKFGPVSPDKDINEINNSNTPTDYSPFILSQHADKEIIQHMGKFAATWEPFLLAMGARAFFALHSFYNERQRHDLALLCLDVAIARGLSTSKNFGFKSASLRKLGRLREAKASASYALELDSNNYDAHYNLAIITNEMGLYSEVDQHLNLVIQSNNQAYMTRLKKYFPERFPDDSIPPV